MVVPACVKALAFQHSTSDSAKYCILIGSTFSVFFVCQISLGALWESFLSRITYRQVKGSSIVSSAVPIYKISIFQLVGDVMALWSVPSPLSLSPG